MRGASVVAVGILAMLAGGCGRDPAPVPPRGAAAATVYKDPVTGRFGPPAGGVRALAPAGRLSDSTAGLVEEAGPRGGRMVRLQGRFLNQLQATRANGVVSAECRTDQERP